MLKPSEYVEHEAEFRIHNYYVALVLGHSAALLLKQLHYHITWTQKEMAGRIWWRSSYTEWAHELGLAVSTVRKLIALCERRGVLVKRPGAGWGKYEAALNYTLNYKVLDEIIEEGKRLELERYGRRFANRNALNSQEYEGQPSTGDDADNRQGSMPKGGTAHVEKRQAGCRKVATSTKQSTNPTTNPPDTPNRVRAAARPSPGVCGEENRVSRRRAGEPPDSAPPPSPRCPSPRSPRTCPTVAPVRPAKAQRAASTPVGEGHRSPDGNRGPNGRESEDVTQVLAKLARRFETKPAAIDPYWRVLVTSVFGVDELTPLTAADRKRTPDFANYCTRAGVSFLDFINWSVRNWKKACESLPKKMGLSSSPLYASLYNLKDRFMAMYKQDLVEHKEQEKARRLDEERQRQLQEVLAAKREKEEKTPRLYRNLDEVPDDHPLHGQIMDLLNEGYDNIAADFTKCVPFSWVNDPQIRETMEKDWETRRALAFRKRVPRHYR